MQKHSKNDQLTRKSKRQLAGGRNSASKGVVDGKVINLTKFQTGKVIFFKDIVPPRIFTRLKFIANRKLNNVGLSTASIQFNANGIYDFDPAVASNKVAGFDELVNIWGRYRVYAVKAKVAYVNNDSTTPIINLGFESEIHSANSKSLPNFDGPNNCTEIIGAANFGTTTLSMKKNGLEVVGDDIVYTEFSYTGTGLSNPTSLWYVSIAADLTASGQTFTSGVTVRAEFELDVEFFERYDVNSAMSHQIKKQICENNIKRLKSAEINKVAASFST